MTGPFPALPDHWRMSRLDRVASVNARIGWKALTADEYVSSGYAFLATPNIKSAKIDFENVNYISQFRYDESPTLKLAVDDVLLAKDGNTLGIVNIVTDLPREATINGSIAVIRSFDIYPNYLRYVIASEPMQSHIQSLKDGMGVPHLFQRDIKRFPICLPPIEEQRRIADFLDASCTGLDRSTGLLLAHSAATLKRLSAYLVATLVAPECIDDRRSVRLKHLFSGMQNGVWGMEPSGTEVDVTCVRVADFDRAAFRAGSAASTKRLVPNEQLRGRILQPGDVLLEKSGGGESSPVGFAASFDGSGKAVCSNFIGLLRPDTGVDGRYVALLLGALYRAGRNIPFIKQTTGIQNLDAAAYLSQSVYVPNQPEQARLAADLDSEIDRVNRIVALREAQRARLRERRQALITAAVTGQVDVTTAGGVGVA